MTVTLELLLRWAHVIGATVLLGTGAGIAFFMLMAHRTRDAALIAHVASTVVIADFLFTATAVLVQPVTGVWLAHLVGWSLGSPWILASVGLYILIGCFWLPVVWMQMRMRDLARVAASEGTPLPPAYFRLYRLWFLSGFPAFFAMLGIIWLMLARPT
ncbi:DUF2269 family protein [Sphingomonas histidinilytica]|jgi:uncharacterized membrane protein|uniref:Uncharacterized membrane protein n=1 Tax=Rhizorhabdus histidinilytica TaxID=439228 RepID=A0A1T5FFR7_9SPHN|nr:DUF2269 domain-containing protein [Rhizorhabdus histidinilytica]MBO9375684.1 DUF2269 family protein [Rhizorhabdus histidinilytica]QEH81123.1 DUF2269 domain-containing protein [Sphingomonas sp. C8-2]SKB94946.1 Uncharacterized membrane protein [Rhizorhabdus histidinilytica]